MHQQQILNNAIHLERLKSLVLTVSKDQPSYYHANEALLNFSPEIRQAVLAQTGRTFKLSAGISTLPSWKEFLGQAQKGLHRIDYYVNYSAPQGMFAAQEALRHCESAMSASTDEVLYPPQGIFLTAGGTGATNLAFEYVKQTFPTANILVLGLAYYIFQFIADRLGLKCQTLLSACSSESPHCSRFLPTPSEVRAALTAETKLLVITQPSNPTGEYYTQAEVAELVDLAREKDLLLLSDTVFADLVYTKEDFASVEEVAFARGSLERILTVRSYSKNYNLAGLRIGYLAVANPHIGQSISFISERIQCCPPTIYTDLIVFTSLLRHIDAEAGRFPACSTREIIKKVSRYYEIGAGPDATQVLIKAYNGYRDFLQSNLSSYAQNFDLALETLGENAAAHCGKRAAFNTLVKITHIPAGINFFDFSVNLYLTTGIETQIGPCFGLGQRAWEQKLGFWLRITHTLHPDELTRTLRTFLNFRDLYMELPQHFLHLGLQF